MTLQNETGLSISLADRFAGCVVGGAIGDGLGTSTEGRTPEAIIERFGGRVEDFVPPFAPKPDGRHKGDGNVSDDTLMVLALIRAYLAKGGQLDAHDMATYLLPEIVDKPTWIPEYKREQPLIERLFYPEKYLLIRLRLATVNPREAGIGNMVNCGAAMYAAPVGMMNAGDPDTAYARAVNIFSAHQYSYGLEAAARIILSQPNIDGYYAGRSGVASQEQFNTARGLVKAFMDHQLNVPAVIRVGGNLEEQAIAILERANGAFPAPVEAYGRNDTPDACVERLDAVVTSYIPAAEITVRELFAPTEPYRFETVTGGTITYDHALCRDCASKACVTHCVPQILSLENGVPVLNITREEATRGGCVECLACEVECYFLGNRGGRIFLPVAGLD